MAYCRFIFLAGSLILLASCATTTSSYQSTVQSWQGSTLATLERYWGQPDKKLNTASGTQYIYQTLVQTPHYPTPPRIGVNQGAKPVIVVVNSASPANSTTSCSAIFTANAKNIITATSIQGFGCQQGGVSSGQLSNPGKIIP